MGKRLNPHRRLLAKQAQALAAERLVQSVVNGEDMAKLQQGRVRSPLNPRVQLTQYAVPRSNWEGKGVRGKIVRGQLKRTIPGQKGRFSKR